jgi:hypothetical protein
MGLVIALPNQNNRVILVTVIKLREMNDFLLVKAKPN